MARKLPSRRSAKRLRPPALVYQADPIRQSLRSLGGKWTLLVLRDIAFLKVVRFGGLLRNNPGLSPRVLSRRLKEMQRDGLVVRRAHQGVIRYGLTARGEDAVLILLALLRYGIKHHSNPIPPPGQEMPPRGNRPRDAL